MVHGMTNTILLSSRNADQKLFLGPKEFDGVWGSLDDALAGMHRTKHLGYGVQILAVPVNPAEISHRDATGREVFGHYQNAVGTTVVGVIPESITKLTDLQKRELNALEKELGRSFADEAQQEWVSKVTGQPRVSEQPVWLVLTHTDRWVGDEARRGWSLSGVFLTKAYAEKAIKRLPASPFPSFIARVLFNTEFNVQELGDTALSAAQPEIGIDQKAARYEMLRAKYGV
jgi:hypothetical protein